MKTHNTGWLVSSWLWCELWFTRWAHVFQVWVQISGLTLIRCRCCCVRCLFFNMIIVSLGQRKDLFSSTQAFFYFIEISFFAVWVATLSRLSVSATCTSGIQQIQGHQVCVLFMYVIYQVHLHSAHTHTHTLFICLTFSVNNTNCFLVQVSDARIDQTFYFMIPAPSIQW